MTHTYAELRVSLSTHEEIKTKLLKADYGHAIDEYNVIDMHGIGLVADAGKIVTSIVMVESVAVAQASMDNWIRTRFGIGAVDKKERALRVLEEAVELAQAEGIQVDMARTIVDHVYSRPVGESSQEVGGIGVCLLGWAAAAKVNLWTLTMAELNRIYKLPKEHFQDRQRIKAAKGIGSNPTEPLV